MLVLRMAHRKWKETKQQPGTAGTGNMLGSCLVSIHFLWAILSTSIVKVQIWYILSSPVCSLLHDYGLHQNQKPVLHGIECVWYCLCLLHVGRRGRERSVLLLAHHIVT